MYDPSAVGKRGSLFGLPYSLEESDLIILPANLDVTTSYGDGTSQAPNLILDESSQLDLSLPFVDKPWELKMVFAPHIVGGDENAIYRSKAKKIIEHLESGGSISGNEKLLKEVNDYCEKIHCQIEEKCEELLDLGKLVGILGGDHSSPFGLIKSLARRKKFGILQIDAHMDLRKAYEGFTYSHASIMYNAMQMDGVQSLTQVGIRDYCEEEEEFIRDSNKKLDVFFDEILFNERTEGVLWKDQISKIVETLPENVYMSFDIDGLDPSLCPNTGTPVPGGLKFLEAISLIDQVVKSGRKIIGFDLCEVGNSAWDANVGARVLYRLSAALGVSQSLLSYK